MSTIGRLEELVLGSSPPLVAYDFGGTLLEFETIHVAGFAAAIAGTTGGATDVQTDLPGLVAEFLAEGLDSISMAARLERHYQLGADPEQLAVDKRRWVERHLQSAQLEPDVVAHLRWARRHTSICIVTQGRSDSARQVLARSIPGPTPVVYGRAGERERLAKADLLRSAAAERLGTTATPSALFVGTPAETPPRPPPRGGASSRRAGSGTPAHPTGRSRHQRAPGSTQEIVDVAEWRYGQAP